MIIIGLSFHSEWLIISRLHENVTLGVFISCCWCFYDRNGYCRVFIHFKMFFSFIVFYVPFKDFLSLAYVDLKSVVSCGKHVHKIQKVIMCKVIFKSFIYLFYYFIFFGRSVHALYQQTPRPHVHSGTQ